MKVCLGEQLCLQKPFLECDMRVCVLYIWQDTHVPARPCGSALVCERLLSTPDTICMCTLSEPGILTHELARPPLDNWNGWAAPDAKRKPPVLINVDAQTTACAQKSMDPRGFR